MAEIDKIPVERFVAVMRENAHLVRVDIEGNDVIVRKDSILRVANKFGVSTHLFF